MRERRKKSENSGLLLAEKQGYADLIGFAAFYAKTFGSRAAAIAFMMRATVEYKTWRKRVEYCPHCRQYVAVRGEVGEDKGVHLATHKTRDNANECPGSELRTRWAGDDMPCATELTSERLRMLAEHTPPTDGKI